MKNFISITTKDPIVGRFFKIFILLDQKYVPHFFDSIVP